MKGIKILFSAICFVMCIQYLPAQVNSPSPYPDRVVLNLTENPMTSVAVTWRTDTTVTEGLCEYQVAPQGPVAKGKTVARRAQTVSVNYEYGDEPGIAVNQHSVVIKDLEQGRKYIYRVGTGNFWSEWYEYQVPQEDKPGFSFIYFGDPQSDLKSQWSRVLRAAYAHEPESAFMLYCGDLINRAGRDLEWHEWFHAGNFIYGMIPQVMTPGNHDYNGLNLDPHWNAQFTQPANGPSGLDGTCYAIDYKNLKLISVNSAGDHELNDEDGTLLETQKVWLDSVLQENTKEWVIVTTHLPFYSPKENRDNAHLRAHFQPILEKYKVDMVLSGHDHSYGRGRATDNPENGHEVMYVVSVSGPKMYEAGDKDWMEKSGAFKQLYQVITIEGDELVYQSFTTDGNVFDKFLLTKRKNGRNKFTEIKPL